MLCLSNVRSLGGSKLPSDIGLLSADMTAFPPLAPVKSGLFSHQGAQPVEPTFQALLLLPQPRNGQAINCVYYGYGMLCLDSCCGFVITHSCQSYRSRGRSDPILPGVRGGSRTGGRFCRAVQAAAAAWWSVSIYGPHVRTSIKHPSIHLTASLAGRKKKTTAAAQHSTGTAQAHCTTEQDRTRQGTAHNNDNNNNNKTRLPCPNGKVAVCRCRLLYAGSSHFSWPHLANPSDLPQALVGDRQPASQLNKRIGRQTSATPPPKVFPGRGPPELHRLHAVGSLCCNLFPTSPPPPLPVLSVLSCLVQPSLIQSSRAEPSPVPCSYPCAVSSSRRSRDSVQWWLSLPISLPACSPVPISAALD